MMSERYIRATIGFVVAFFLIVLVTTVLESDNGTTYQVYRFGRPAEIYTASWDKAASAILIAVACGISLILGYRRGYREDASLSKTTPFPPWLLETGLVVLIAALSIRRSLFITFDVRLEVFQIALVASAVAFGPGTAYLAGGPASLVALLLLFPDALGAFYSYLCGAVACGLQGILVGKLTRQFRLSKLVVATVGATFLGLVPYLFFYWQMNMRLPVHLSLSWSSAIIMFLNVALGLVIGILARVLWTGKLFGPYARSGRQGA